MAMPLPMPDEAPVTSAFWLKSFRSMGQAGITTGGSVSSLSSPGVLASIVHAPLLLPLYSLAAAPRYVQSPWPEGRSDAFVRKIPIDCRFHDLRLSTGRAGSRGR